MRVLEKTYLSQCCNGFLQFHATLKNGVPCLFIFDPIQKMPNALCRFYRIAPGVLEVLQIFQVSLGCREFRECESKFYFAVEELL